MSATSHLPDAMTVAEFVPWNLPDGSDRWELTEGTDRGHAASDGAGLATPRSGPGRSRPADRQPVGGPARATLESIDFTAPIAAFYRTV
jgi:hypothetical protein